LNSITKEEEFKIGKETWEDIGQMVEKDLHKLVDLRSSLSFQSNCIDIGIDQTLKSPHVSTLNVPFKLDNEKNGLENNWYDGYKSNNFHGYKPYEFQTNKMEFQRQKRYVAQEQQIRFGTKEQDEGKLENNQHRFNQAFITSSKDNDLSKECSLLAFKPQAMPFDLVSDISLGVEAIKDIISPSPFVTSVAMASNQTSQVGNKNLFLPCMMYSWYGIENKKLISRKTTFDKHFGKNNLRTSLDLPNISHIYTSFRNKNGTKSYTIVKDAQVKGILVPKFPCNNIVEEHESKKCERSPIGGSTPLKFHHFKVIPKKCKSLKMVVESCEISKLAPK
jgi:hypothetical protein